MNPTFKAGDLLTCIRKEKVWFDLTIGRVYEAANDSFIATEKRGQRADQCEFVEIVDNDSCEPYTEWKVSTFEPAPIRTAQEAQDVPMIMKIEGYNTGWHIVGLSEVKFYWDGKSWSRQEKDAKKFTELHLIRDEMDFIENQCGLTHNPPEPERA